MRGLMGVVAFMAACLPAILFGSDVKLIDPADAIRLIGDKRIVFVSGESNDTYQKHHITGSVSMPARDLYRSEKMQNLHCTPLCNCPEEAQEFIRSKGIRNDQMIIAYDDFQGSDATAVYGFFEIFGHRDLKILNGGLASIKALDPNQQVFDKLQAEREAIMQQVTTANLTGNTDNEEKLESQAENIKAKMDLLESQLLIRTGEEKKHKASSYRIDIEKINREYIADKEEVAKVLDDILKDGNESKFVIIDAGMRDEVGDENSMESSLPGIKMIECEKITDLEKKRSFKSLEEMQKVFDDAGIIKEKRIYACCRTDAGCSFQIVSALRLLGYQKVKTFTECWENWVNDSNTSAERSEEQSQ